MLSKFVTEPNRGWDRLRLLTESTWPSVSQDIQSSHCIWYPYEHLNTHRLQVEQLTIAALNIYENTQSSGIRFPSRVVASSIQNYNAVSVLENIFLTKSIRARCVFIQPVQGSVPCSSIHIEFIIVLQLREHPSTSDRIDLQVFLNNEVIQ